MIYRDLAVTLHTGDALAVLRTLPSASVQCCVTSPPYYSLRNYGVVGQLGLEDTPDEYVATLVTVFREVRRVLREDGVLFMNLGDAYANDGKWGGSTSGKHVSALHGNSSIGRQRRFTGLKAKDLMGMPWMVAFALRDDGWYLRADIIWVKPNPMPESVTDRPTKAHEYLFLLTKSERYYYDAEAIKEPAQDWGERLRTHTKYASPRDGSAPDSWLTNGNRASHGRNRRSVWTIATEPYPEAHFATFPTDLVKPCVLAGSRPGDTMLDPFAGSGTALYVAKELGRRAIGIELNPAYVQLAVDRLRQEVLTFT